MNLVLAEVARSLNNATANKIKDISKKPSEIQRAFLVLEGNNSRILND
jgi:hypothetical protein